MILLNISNWCEHGSQFFVWHRIYWKGKWTPFCKVYSRKKWESKWLDDSPKIIDKEMRDEGHYDIIGPGSHTE
jgi:hypothetical protein